MSNILRSLKMENFVKYSALKKFTFNNTKRTANNNKIKQ